MWNSYHWYFLTNQAKRVYGIETLKDAVEDVGENANLNKVRNAEFIVGKAELEAPKLLGKGIKPDVIVVDPPQERLSSRAFRDYSGNQA